MNLEIILSSFISHTHTLICSSVDSNIEELSSYDDISSKTLRAISDITFPF